MIRRKLRRWLPHQDHLRDQAWLRWCAPVLGHPRLWHLHRRAVALGVAIGMFTGLFPAPFQMVSAAAASIVLRANIPAAVFTTLYTNPVTFVPLYIVAYHLGRFVTGTEAAFVEPPDPTFTWDGMMAFVPALIDWMLGLGSSLVVGVIVLGAIFAVVGYFATLLAWRVAVTLTWRRRSALRAARKPAP